MASASSQIDGAVFQRTRDTLGKIIKKPPLTDKLLGRPPFRYLHDVISEVSKQTRFFKGLYTPKEMDAKAMQEREDKVAFLQKAVDTLSFTTGEVVKVRPSKVVAGHEADRTNEFLQILGISLLKELDSSEAIKKVLKGEKPSDTLLKDKKKRADKDHSKDRTRDDSKDKTKDKSKERRVKRSGSKEREVEASLTSKSHQSLKDSSQPEPRPTHRPSRTRPPPPESEQPAPTNEQGDPPSPTLSVEDEGLGGSETKLDRPSSAKGTRRRTTAGNADSDIENVPPESMAPSSPTPNVSQPLMPPMKRPGSARPAPPKIVLPSVEDTTITRIPSGGVSGPEVAPVIMDGPAGEDGGLDGEDDDQFVVQDSTPLELPKHEAFQPTTTHDQPEGALTKNIVAMKERLEGKDVLSESIDNQKTSLSEAQRQKERVIVTKEIEKLQASIQTLCKSANPLGKIMDYVQEDMDSMQKELDLWKTENEKHGESLRQEESITQHELSPLRGSLEDLEAKLREQMDLISASKATIVRNDEKMQRMLTSITLVS